MRSDGHQKYTRQRYFIFGGYQYIPVSSVHQFVNQSYSKTEITLVLIQINLADGLSGIAIIRSGGYGTGSIFRTQDKFGHQTLEHFGLA